MKLLLDENLPKKLKRQFAPGHAISTVQENEWSRIKNGVLLALLVSSGFEGMVTSDKNLAFQQNLSRFPIKIFVLDAANSKLQTLEPFVEKLNLLLSGPLPDQQVFIIEISNE